MIKIFIYLMNSWWFLLFAGLFEIGFTTSMKLSNGFTNYKYVICFIFCAALSFYCLNKSTNNISLGTAYAIWTGIGAFGTAVIGMVFFGDATSVARILLLTLLIASIVGLKFLG